MEQPSNFQVFRQNIADLIGSIKDCAEQARILPCLVLLYSGMDVMASLEAQLNEANQTTFVRWIDRYFSPEAKLNCKAIDLYAARCGIVHAFSANSRLFYDGKATRIQYAWGKGEVEKLRKASLALNFVAHCVHIDDLIAAFTDAVMNHLNHAGQDKSVESRLLDGAGLWLSILSRNKVDDFLEVCRMDGQRER